MDKEFEVLTFNALNQEMSIDVEFVEIVIDKTEITPVPLSKNIIEGVINLRGKIIPVLNLSKLLGAFKEETNKKIIIVKVEDVEFGIIVNEVNGVLRTKDSEVDTSFGKVNTYGKKAKGLIKKGSRLIVYLDMYEILKEIIGSEVA